MVACMTYVPHATFASCDGHDLNTSDHRRANPIYYNTGKVCRMADDRHQAAVWLPQ